MKFCIGIVSYLPDRIRNYRIGLINNLLNSCSNIFPGIDIIIVAQNYRDFIPSSNNRIILLNYRDKLGIHGARKALREYFINSDYDYLITLDDDSILKGTKENGDKYLKLLENNPNKFGIMNWARGQLILFAISRSLYTRVEYPTETCEGGQIFEDIYISSICKHLCPNYIDLKSSGISINWDNETSTWWDRNKYNLKAMERNTKAVIDRDIAAKYTTKVSVIIPVYNQEELVIKAIKSVPLRGNIEVLVIDDCSTDNTYENLKNIDYPIRLFKTEVNSGAGVARNIGLDNAVGEYILFLDSDDYFDTKLFNDIIDKNRLVGDIIFYDLVINNGDRWDSIDKKGRIYLPYGPVKFIKRSYIGNIRFQKVRISEDALFWEDITKNRNPEISHINEILLHYNHPRKGSNDWKRTHNEWEPEALEEFKEVMKNNNYSYNIRQVIK